MIDKIRIKNYKIFKNFCLSLNKDLNIIVGNNESGKSTILEAINIALTKKLNGRHVENELSPYLFNKTCVDEYLKSLLTDSPLDLPKVVIELFLSEKPELQFLRGSNNSEKLDAVGIKVEIVFDEDYREEYEDLLKNKAQIKMIPIEYYKVHWYSFANNAISIRSLPIGLSYIDATTIRLQSGADYYLQNIINDGLDIKEKVALTVAYRSLKENFSSQPSIQGINTKLTQRKGAITDKDLAISIDISQKSNWETNLIPHLDELPFQLVGKGEQNALKIMLALERQAEKSHVILIEEPENHLSFSSMNILITKIKQKCEGKQIIIATHSAYVLNKLGIEKVIFLHDYKTSSLKNLPKETQKYFKILPGYDTLRLILAQKSILVEGPSDELIIQKAYFLKHGKLPIENGIDVISVRGLAFKRFLDIAKELEKEVSVVTDNDGNHQINVIEKYKDYVSTTTKVFADSDNTLSTLEPQMIKSNSLVLLNKIFVTTYANIATLETYMINNKTEWALKVFETKEVIKFPKYVEDAIA